MLNTQKNPPIQFLIFTAIGSFIFVFIASQGFTKSSPIVGLIVVGIMVGMGWLGGRAGIALEDQIATNKMKQKLIEDEYYRMEARKRVERERL